MRVPTYQTQFMRDRYAEEALRLGWRRRWELRRIHVYARLLAFIAAYGRG